MAYYGSLGDIDVGAISKSVSDTATDVFVYDTRKDSDGGAWRKRTQHTSWYNETLNTATRGARREFPAVAVIVLQQSRMTIYDGDDPNMPMWMVFNLVVDTHSIISSGIFPTAASLTSVFALNGVVCTSHSGDSKCLTRIFFISDNAIHNPGNLYWGQGNFRGNISQRNQTLGYFIITNGGRMLGNGNDVAMTVLPNAPINPSTGLPIPTIAVATNGGVSVIKDDGTVVNITCNNGQYTTSKKVTFLDDNALGLSLENNNAANEDSFYIFNIIPSVSTIITVDTKTGSPISANAFYSVQYSPHVGAVGVDLHILGSSLLNRTITRANRLNFANTYGLSTIAENRSSPNNGMVAYATTSYNTGWMHGDIKGAWLSDTSTASVTGTELNQYGDFASTTGWGSKSASWTISGGVASVSSGAGYQFLGSTSGTLTNGRKYAITVNVTAFTAGRLEFSQTNSSNVPFNLGSTGIKTLILTYTGSTGYALGIYGYGDASYGFTIDDLYVRELSEADRSVNNTGLAVYGTITKTAVATGANLVGYTNSSSNSNYLVLPLSTSIIDLTSNFSVSYWFKCDGTQYNGWSIVENDISSQSGYNKTVINWFVQGGSTMGYRGASITGSNDHSYPTDVWNCMVITKSSIGIQMYINSILIATTSGTCVNPTVSYSLRLFQWSFGTAFYGSSTLQMSLFRLSQSVPSPTQILKIYNDEKTLFHPGAQATLYGASDAVTALAYDDTTDLLSVGTSSGRSDFSGLKRINNTTTAVTTAISASNGLIAEQ